MINTAAVLFANSTGALPHLPSFEKLVWNLKPRLINCLIKWYSEHKKSFQRGRLSWPRFVPNIFARPTFKGNHSWQGASLVGSVAGYYGTRKEIGYKELFSLCGSFRQIYGNFMHRFSSRIKIRSSVTSGFVVSSNSNLSTPMILAIFHQIHCRHYCSLETLIQFCSRFEVREGESEAQSVCDDISNGKFAFPQSALMIVAS